MQLCSRCWSLHEYKSERNVRKLYNRKYIIYDLKRGQRTVASKMMILSTNRSASHTTLHSRTHGRTIVWNEAHTIKYRHTRLLPDARHDLNSLYIAEMCGQSPVSLRFCFGKTTAWEIMVRNETLLWSFWKKTNTPTHACRPQTLPTPNDLFCSLFKVSWWEGK